MTGDGKKYISLRFTCSVKVRGSDYISGYYVRRAASNKSTIGNNLHGIIAKDKDILLLIVELESDEAVQLRGIVNSPNKARSGSIIYPAILGDDEVSAGTQALEIALKIHPPVHGR